MYRHCRNIIGMNNVVVWEENSKCFVRFSRPLHKLKLGQFTSLSGREQKKKCTKMQNARAGRAELLSLFVKVIPFFCTAHLILRIVFAAFHADYLKTGNKGRFCCSRAFKWTHDNSSRLRRCCFGTRPSRFAENDQLPLCHHLSLCCEETSTVTPHF